AIGVVPPEMQSAAVSSEYPVYQVAGEALPAYVQLVFRTSFFRQKINSMISGASGRRRVQPSDIESLRVPLPPLPVQRAIVAHWETARRRVDEAQAALQALTDEVNAMLFKKYRETCRCDVLGSRALTVSWRDLLRWDVKTARAAAFREANPT